MPTVNLQNSFLGGELSPSMYARSDDAYYKHGAAKVTNFIVKPTGALQKRSGFRFVGEIPNDKPARLIPFRFASTQTLILLFTDKKMQILTNGKFVMDGSRPYSLSTPYPAESLSTLDYSQNADVVTLTSTGSPPMELRRYGATKWELAPIDFVPKILPPKNISAHAHYPPPHTKNHKGEDIDDPNAGTYDIINAAYVVTAVGEDGIESRASSVCAVKCNYYITGATVELSWDPVGGASHYRVYRSVSGIYGFLGQTFSTNLTDSGDTPDTGTTPPRYKKVFTGTGGSAAIVSISVVDGGHGYTSETSSGPISGNYIYMPYVPIIGVSASGGYDKEPSLVPPKDMKYILTLTNRDTGESCTATMNADLYEGYIKSEQVRSPMGHPLDFWDLEARLNYCPEKQFQDRGFRFTFDKLITFSDNMEVRLAYSEIHDAERSFKMQWGGVGIGDIPPNGPRYVATTAQLKMVDSIESYLGSWRYSFLQGNSVLFSDIFPSGTITEALPLTISDATGKGASAACEVHNGVVTRVKLLDGGYGYTSPVATLNHPTGSGAKFVCTLGEAQASEFPATSTQYDQRRVFAGSVINPLKVWMTNAGKQNIMAYHLPLKADDRIEIVAVTNDADMIRHTVALDSLILFTGSSELRVYTQNSDALSPDSIAVRAQSYVGANEVQPIVVNSSIVYAASRGGHPRRLTFSSVHGGYVSDDLGIRCAHLFDGSDIVGLTYIKSPIPLVYAVTSDGRLLVCTFIPEENVNSWSEIVSEGASFENVAAVSEGDEDHLYVIVRRDINGVSHKYVERMANLTTVNPRYCRLLDSYLDAVFSSPQREVSGLNHLEGERVGIFVDGRDCGYGYVRNGSLRLPRSGKEVAIGLPINAKLITLPLETIGGVPLTTRNFSKLYLRVSGTGNVYTAACPLIGSAREYKCHRDDAIYNVQNKVSQVLPMTIADNWDLQTQVMVRSDDALPLEIQAILALATYSSVSSSSNPRQSGKDVL